MPHQFASTFSARCARLIATFALAALPVLSQAAPIQYAYDELGRLVQAIAPDGGSVQYTYDAVGNLLATKKNTTATISIAEFTPNGGPVGTAVTISGSGFNPIAANNTVKFNGVSASVSSASATALVAVVPASATTGPLTITNANGNATSAIPFTVGPSLPSTSGTPVAVNLAANQSSNFNFNGNVGQGYVLGFSGVAFTPTGDSLTAKITQPDGSTLVTCIVSADTGCVLPYLTVAGNYTVAVTAGSSAVTASVLLNADLSGTLVTNVASSFVADRIGQAATYLFSGVAGQAMRLFVNNDDIPGSTTIQLFSPAGVLLQTATATASAGANGTTTLTFANLPASGNYKIRVLPPASNATGRLSITAVQIVSGVFAIDGAAQSVNLPAGALGAYTFSGTAGQRLGFGLTSLVTTPTNKTLTVSVIKPDGTPLATTSTTTAPFGNAIPILPSAGTYTVLLDPGVNAATLSAQISTDISGGNLSANATASTFAPAKVGQAVNYSFTGVAAATDLRLVFTANTVTGNMDLTVYQPNGSLLQSTTLYASATAIDLATLPVAGTYSVRLMPQAAATGSVAVALTQASAGALGIDDAAALTVNLKAGQKGSYAFNGTTGQKLAVGISSLTTTPVNNNLALTIIKPDGNTLGSFSVNGAAGGYGLPTLPATGAYKVQIDPTAAAANFNLWLSTDATGTLTANGAALTLAPIRAGQAASYTFSGTAGQDLSLALSSDTFPGNTYVTVYQPDGSQLSGTSVYYGSGAATAGALVLSNLPVSGNYSVRVAPSGGLGSIAVALKTEVAGSIAIDGSATTVSLTAAQTGRYTFTGSVGQNLGLGLASIATTPASGNISGTIYKPDGTTFGSFNTSGNAGNYALPTLPVAGTYSVSINAGSSAANLYLLLSTDATATLTANATPTNFTTSRVGRFASYSFAGSAGQNVSLLFSADTFPGYTYFYVTKPDGTSLNTGSVYYSSGAATSGSLVLNNLPSTGNYRVRIVPSDGALGGVSVGLTTELGGAVTVDGTPTAVTLTAAQNARYTFTGSVGKRLGIGLAGITTTPAAGNVNVIINKPDGSQLGSFNATPSASGYTLPPLPLAGSYSVLINPGSNAASFNLLVSSDASATLVANGAALSFSPTRVGQSASYSFSGSAGQTVNLSFAGDTFVGYSYFYVYRPDGTQLNSAYLNYTSGVGTATSLSLVGLPVTGTYIVRAVPPSGALGTVGIALNAQTGLTADAAATPVSLASGRTGLFSFTGSAGQRLSLGLTGIATTPAAATLNVTINKPDGSSLTSFTTSGNDSGYTLPFLPVAGTYSVLISPGSSAVNFNLLLSSDASGTLVGNGPAVNFSPTRVGQSASYAFDGAAGQTVSLSFTGDTFPGYSYVYVYKPDGTQLNSTYLNYSSGVGTATSLSLVNLPVSGTYSLRFMPPSGALGTIGIGLNAQVGLTADAAATPVSLTSGRTGLFSFTGSVGQRLSLGLAGITTTPAATTLNITINKPDGSQLGSFSTSGTASGYTLPLLPVAGTYSVLISPATSSANFNLLLSSDATGNLAANGAAINFTPTRIGQSASYTFSGTAGQTVDLSMAADTFVGYSYVYVYKPDGTQLNSIYLNYSSGAATSTYLSLPNLPATGTYVVRVTPASGAIGALAISLNAQIGLAPDAAATPFSLTAGRTALFSFSGSVGQRLSLGVTGITPTPADATLNLIISKPDGTQLSNFTTVGNASGFTLPPLPVAGTYSVLVSPGAGAANFNLLLSSDATGNLAANGAAITFAPTRVGQSASYTFSGTAGQTVDLSMAGNTFAGGYTYFYVYKPDGTPLNYSYLYYSSGTPTATYLSLSNLPVTGTYVVRVTPANGVLGNVSLALNTQSTLVADAAATAVTLTSGRTGLYSFSGSVGQRLSLGLTAIATIPATSLNVTINKPDGSYLTGFTTNGSTSGFTLPPLPLAGTYSVLVSPGTSAANFNLLLSSDATGNLSANGATLNFTPSRVGQSASYTFSATAGQTLNLAIGGDTFPGYTYLYVYKPDGTQLNSVYSYFGSGAGTATSLLLPNLPVTGAYTVRVTPPNGVLGALNVALNAQTGLTIDAAPVAVSASGGLAKLFSFSGNAGQSLSFGFSGISTTPAAGSLNVSVYRPDGSYLTSFDTTGNTFGYGPSPLPATGAYSVVIRPANGGDANFNLLMSSDLTGTLPPNGASVSFNPTRPGQAGAYSFSANAGQIVNLSFASDTFAGSTLLYVYKPDGTLLTSTSAYYSSGRATATSLTLPNLPVSGTYVVRVYPSNGALGTLALALNTQQALTLDGAPRLVTLFTGRTMLYSFNASANQKVSFGFTSINLAPASNTLTLTLYQPDGSYLTSFSTTGSTFGYAPAPLPVAGTYSVLISPGDSAAGFNLLMSTDISGTLTANAAPITFTPTRPGQAGSYSFSGTAGQNANLAISADTFAGSTLFYVYKPDGTLLTNTSVYYGSGAGTSGSLALPNLPASGTYLLRIYPSNGALGSVAVGLTN